MTLKHWGLGSAFAENLQKNLCILLVQILPSFRFVVTYQSVVTYQRLLLQEVLFLVTRDT